MKGVVYYNNKGKIFDIIWGDDVEPDEEGGVPFLEIDVPVGAVISEVDLSHDPPKIVFSKYPEDDYDILNKKVDNTITDLDNARTSISTQGNRLEGAEDSITNLELAVASLYEGGLGA